MGEKTFEQTMEELEKTVRKLEEGNIPLDESISSFESGVKLAKECEKKLEEAKGRIEKLIKDESGKTKVEPFEPRE